MINTYLAIFLFTVVTLVTGSDVCFAQELEQGDIVDSVRVVAKNGEGIYSILRNHGIKPTSKSIADFLRLNKGEIAKGRQLIKGASYLLPLYVSQAKEQIPLEETTLPPEEENDSTLTDVLVESEEVQSPIEVDREGTFEKFPIFGPKHEEVQIVSDRLKGTNYYLISGHGGPDPGATSQYGKNELSEDEYAYDVTLRLARRLLSHSATVFLIIRDPNDGIRGEKILKSDKDEVAYPDLKIPFSQKQRLRQRTNVVNKLYKKHRGTYRRLVVVHVDSRSEGKNIDVFFYHARNSEGGKSLALQLQKVFKEKYAQFQPGRNYFGSVTERDLFVLERTSPPAVFIELGNIKNSTDQKRFLLDSNREALANWISQGLLLEYEKYR